MDGCSLTELVKGGGEERERDLSGGHVRAGARIGGLIELKVH